MTKARAPYFPFYPEDFMHGCKMAGMTPEQVGAYIYMICLEWLNRGPLEDDVRKLAMGTGWDVRQVKRLVNDVVRLGKYERSAGRLLNERIEDEITKFCRKMRNKEAVAIEQLPDSSAVAIQELPDSSVVAIEHLSKKTNENNVNDEKQGRDTRAKEQSRAEQKKDNPPAPQEGGGQAEFELDGKPAEKATRRAAIAAAKRRAANEAIDIYNKAADHWGLHRCNARTDERLKRVEKRLDDIGGLERFKTALRAIGKDDWLMGRVSKPGEKPFKLDIDRLLSSRSGMGDVLARLLDSATAKPDLVGPNGKRWGWWREKQAELQALPLEIWRQTLLNAKPNGTWPWWVLTAPPGHEECLMPLELQTEYGLVDIYKGQITHA